MYTLSAINKNTLLHVGTYPQRYNQYTAFFNYNDSYDGHSVYIMACTRYDAFCIAVEYADVHELRLMWLLND